MRNIAPNHRVGNKFKINTIAVPGNIVVYDQQTITLPTVNTIAYLLFFGTISFDDVVFDDTISTILHIDPKKIIFQSVARNLHIPVIINLYSAGIIERTETRVLKYQAIYL